MTKMLVYYITKMLQYYKKLHKKLLNYNTSIKTTPKIKKNYSINSPNCTKLQHSCKNASNIETYV